MNEDAVETEIGPPLAKILQLRRVDHDVFAGESAPGHNNHVFGGQLLAQATVAAGATVTSDRAAHSMHAYFLRAGDSSHPVEYRVAHVRDGRSLSVRTVSAEQDGRLLMTQTISFAVERDGPSHEATGVPSMPDPDSFLHFARPGETKLSHRYLLEMRRVPPGLDQRAVRGGQALWLRAPASVGDSVAERRGAVALATDYGLLEPLALQHGIEFGSSSVQFASLDHSLWWFADVDVADWMLVVQDAPWSAHGRGLVRASVFSRTGELVAIVQQEGLIRVVNS